MPTSAEVQPQSPSVTPPAEQLDKSKVAFTVATVEGNCGADDWAESFEIPWSKCRASLIESVNCKAVPSAGDIRELVCHTMSDVFVHTRRPSRKVLRTVARKIVTKQPSSFADYINGKMVDDGVNSLMLMLESKKENLNRQSRQTSNADQGISVKNTSKSSNNSHRVVIDDETRSKMEKTRKQLIDYYTNRNLADQSDIERCMLATYPYQRYDVNNDVPLRELFDKWPFLGETKYVLKHFKYYTTVDIDSVLRTCISSKCDILYSFMSANTTTTNTVVRMMERSAKPQWPLYFLPLIMAYFREDISHLLHFSWYAKQLCL